MLQLPNGCWISDPSVNPRNWKTGGIKLLKQDWYIQYWFHDPIFSDHPKLKKGKLCIVKGMNGYKTLAERRESVEYIMDQEIRILQLEGFNPITGQWIAPLDVDIEVDPKTSFIDALKAVAKKVSVAASSKSDIDSVITGMTTAATQLRMISLPVSLIKRKELKAMLDHLTKTNHRFSANRFNKYRSYLMILYAELIEMGTVDDNPLLNIKKKKTVKKLRKLLTLKERIRINDHLLATNYNFWRLLQIFFHSGSRETELMQIRREDINFDAQMVKYLVKKGRSYEEVLRPIKDSALYLWKEIYELASPGDYIFSNGLVPGRKSIRPDQITRRWNRHVKKKLGIDADFYCLKHMNLDETAAELNLKDASAMASHKSTVITMSAYTLGEKGRQDERLKKVTNTFA